MKKTRGIRKPKGYKPGALSHNAHLASWGTLSPEAVKVFKHCRAYDLYRKRTIKMGKGYSVVADGYDTDTMKAFGLKKSEVDNMPAEIGMEIANRVLCGLAKRDGYFFRDLARLCEWRNIEIDRLRQQIEMLQRPPSPPPATVKQIQTMLASRGQQYSTRQIYKACKQMGYVPAAGVRSGRPKTPSGGK